MPKYRVGFIGTGRPWKTEGATGFGMAHPHAAAYARLGDDCELAAACDIVADRVERFAQEHSVPRTYLDYQQMLRQEQLDIVSICTWPHLHAEMTIAAAHAGVKAIHCEKPMALTFGDSKRMARVCEEKKVQLTFNHQRRFGEAFQKAGKLLKDGAIGQLLRLEAQCPDLYDWGTHWVDMLFYYNDHQPAEWVMGQVELRGYHTIFGAPLEGQALCHFKFRNGVRATIVTGHDADLGAENRLIGTDGVIEIGAPGDVLLRIRARGHSDWQAIPTSEGLHEYSFFDRAIADTVESLRTGREPALSARTALLGTEVIFATYESSRRGARIDLPLQVEGSPLKARLVQEGIV
jgi:UDP-N-acetylglucosamine 3-dehydrogenase